RGRRRRTASHDRHSSPQADRDDGNACARRFGRLGARAVAIRLLTSAFHPLGTFPDRPSEDDYRRTSRTSDGRRPVVSTDIEAGSAPPSAFAAYVLNMTWGNGSVRVQVTIRSRKCS